MRAMTEKKFFLFIESFLIALTISKDMIDVWLLLVFHKMIACGTKTEPNFVKDDCKYLPSLDVVAKAGFHLL